MNHFTFEERKKLQELLQKSYKVTEIAQMMGKSRATIYNELNRNSENKDMYDATTAQKLHISRISNRGVELKIKNNTDVLYYISAKILEEHKSVPTIALELQATNLPHLSANTIYSYIDRGIIPSVSRTELKSNTTTMFSDGSIRIPNWVREKYGFSDGDMFEFLPDEETIILKKITNFNADS